MRRPPQTAEEARECIAGIFKAYKSAKGRKNKVAGFLRLDSAGYTNWTQEARHVWERAYQDIEA
jgi:hypothetical protein